MTKRRVGIMLDLTWPYRRHVDIFAGTQRYVEQHSDWQCEIDEFAEVGLTAARSKPKKYDGIIARATPELARRARRAKIPVVNVWYASEVRDQLPGVFADFSEVGRLAAEHLIERGFRSFGCLSSSSDTADGVMVSAFHRAIKEIGGTCRCVRVSRVYYKSRDSWKRFQRTLDQWIDQWTPPMAVFVALSDITARYVVHACRRHGLTVPDDVALVTPTNELAVGLAPPPSLTSVEINYEQIGYEAAKILDGLMHRKRPPAGPVLLEPLGIIPRQSTDFFAVDDEVVAGAMRFIEQNVVNRIGVNDVATAVGVSRRTLERRFAQDVGRQVSAEIRRLRLEKAKRLLAESDLLIKQIATQTGFANAIRMREVFIRDLGLSPREYRDSMKMGR